MYAFVVFISFVLLINGNNDHKEFLEKSELRKGNVACRKFYKILIRFINVRTRSHVLIHKFIY